MQQVEIEMLSNYWDRTINTDRLWRVDFTFAGEPLHVFLLAKSFVEASNKFIMSRLQLVEQEIIEKYDDGYSLMRLTVRFGPELIRQTHVRALDAYAALHILSTEVVKATRITDLALSIPHDITDAGPDRVVEQIQVRRFEVNLAISKLRSRFVTPIVGQEMIYLRKEEEARRFLASEPAPKDLDDFPMIEAEVGITAPTPAELAEMWLEMGREWKRAAAATERLRFETVAALKQATSIEAVEVVMQGFYAQVAVLEEAIPV